MSKQQTIAYLGPAGTFTEMAVRQLPDAVSSNLMPVTSVLEALDAVLGAQADRAVVPIENSIEGGVSATLDALATTPGVQIFGEYLIPVSFNLLGLPGKTLADIKIVLTHPVAYAQCRSWLAKNVPGHTHIPSSSTASAAKSVRDGAAADAAIAPAISGELYELQNLAEDIGDNKNAQTRFIEIGLSGKPNPKTGSDKTSVIVELPDDRSGGLLELLEQFATRGVNLTKIESRPVADHFGRYRFYIDAQGHIEDEAIAEALMGLHRFSPKVIYLGSYKKADRSLSVHLGKNTNQDYTSAQDWLDSLRG